MSLTNRRQFLQTASAAGASFLITGTRASGQINGANNRLRIGVVGVNGRGSSHIGGWLSQENVEVAYLVDPDQKVLARRINDVERRVRPSGGLRSCWS